MGEDAWESWVQPGRDSQRKNVYLRTKYSWNDPIKMEGKE
jgi:hypothetical protein